MLIHKNQAELQTLVAALQTLPIEGKDLAEVVHREWTRQHSLMAMQTNVQSTTSSAMNHGINVVHSSNVSIHHTDYPTTLIDDYWGLRLGLIRG